MIALLTVAAILLSAVSGLPGVASRREDAGERLSAVLLSVGALCGVAASIMAVASGPASVSWPWRVPGGALALRVDALAAMFLIQIFVVAPLGAVYGLGYWAERAHRDTGRKVRLFYGLVTAGMAVVVVAANAVLFLVGWEIMALAAFLLISAEHHEPTVRESGLVYLVATRVGTLCLFAFFALLHTVNGSLELRAPAIDAAGPVAGALMVLGLVGFGVKAGAMPLHFWLPGAHASAPSHISALMSGVLIKMGIYGLVRFTSFFATPPSWWGLTMVAAGGISGVLGVLFAIGQHDIKRLLAYHSVENIGIILIGLGVGLVGKSQGDEVVFALGVGGGLLHVWNHGLFKSLLFLGAGSVVHATHTRDVDRLGGLGKRMPWSAGSFLVGAVAICGLPPLNGFVSELFIYLALLRASTSAAPELWGAGIVAAPILALIGALALACFVKVFGGTFLGEPRSPAASAAGESPRTMLLPMGAIAALCAAIGAFPALATPILDAALDVWPRAPGGERLSALAPVRVLSIAAVALVVVTGVVLGRIERARKTAAVGPTWDCGYAAPSGRMQYTSSSFAELLVHLFAGVLRPRRRAATIEGTFPHATSFHTDVPEIVLDRALVPVFRLLGRGLHWFRWVQLGSVQVYLLYILGTLLLLMSIWR